MRNWSYTIKEGEHAGTTLWSGRYCAIAAFVFCKINGAWCVLANKRGSGTPDFQGMWNCTCGYLEADECAEEGCSRETREETGYDIPASMFELVGVETRPAICEHGNVTIRYFAILDKLPEQLTPEGGEENEVDAVKWIPISKLDDYEWAFNHKNRITEIFHGWVG